MPAGYRLRVVDRSADVATAARIQQACDRFDVGFADQEETWVRDDWRQSSLRGAWIVEGESGAVAFANLMATDPSATFDAYTAILPPHRDVLREPIVTHLQEQARNLAAEGATMIVPVASTEGAGPVLESLGFAFSRAFWHMERPIDASFSATRPPEGVTLRRYVSPDDDRLGWRLLEETFAGHYAIDPRPFDAYRADVLEHERWDPSLVAFAIVDGDEAGIVVAEIIDDVGWI